MSLDKNPPTPKFPFLPYLKTKTQIPGALCTAGALMAERLPFVVLIEGSPLL